MRGDGVWLLTKQRKPEPLGDSGAVVVAWSRAGLSEWARELESKAEGDLRSSRHVRDLEREVRLMRLPPVGRREVRFRVEAIEWNPKGRSEKVPILDDSEKGGRDSQLEGLIHYAQVVERYLAFIAHSQRRNYFKLRDTADLDVDLHRLHAWQTVAPMLAEMRRLERGLAKLSERLPFALHEAVHMGLPVTMLARAANRSRQWVYESEQRTAHLPEPVNLGRLLAEMKRHSVRLRTTLVAPEILPIVYGQIGDIRAVIESMIDIDAYITVHNVEEYVTIAASKSYSSFYDDPDLAEQQLARLKSNLSHVTNSLTEKGGALTIDLTPGAYSWRRQITIELKLEAGGLHRPLAPGRPRHR